MIEIGNIIELKTNTPDKLSFATRYLVEEHFTFDLTVEILKWRGTAHFCVSRQQIETLCNDLTKMYSSLTGTTRLEDNDSDGFIELEITKNGKLNINTQVGGSTDNNFLKLSFATDQTCIPDFVQDFRNLLKTN